MSASAFRDIPSELLELSLLLRSELRRPEFAHAQALLPRNCLLPGALRSRALLLELLLSRALLLLARFLCKLLLLGALLLLT